MHHSEASAQSCVAAIRSATKCDATDIARIHVESFRTTYHGEVPEQFLQRLSVSEISSIWRDRIEQLTTQQQYLWVASTTNQVLGFCYAGPVEDESGRAMIYSLHVIPDNHRAGIGNLLLSTATQALCQTGYRILELWVVVTNTMAINFYEKHGWVRDGTCKVDSLSLDGGAQPQVDVVRYQLHDCEEAVNVRSDTP